MAKSKTPPATAAPAGKDLDGDGKIEDWEVENALSDLQRVEEHKTKPQLMKKVGKLAGRKVKALKGISSIQDIRDTYKKKYGGPQ